MTHQDQSFHQTDHHHKDHAAYKARRLRLSGGGNSSRRHSFRFYSSFVAIMRFVLPGIAFGLLAWVVITTETNIPGFRPGDTMVTMADIRRLATINPIYHGLDQNDQHFSLHASAAVLAPEDPHLVELDQPKGEMMLEDKSWVMLASEAGLYDRKHNRLDLFGPVTILHEEGYNMTADTAHVEARMRVASSQSRVLGTGPRGNIEAAGFRFETQEDRLTFIGPAYLVLYPKSLEDQQAYVLP